MTFTALTPLEAVQSPVVTLNDFELNDLAIYKRARSFPKTSSGDMRVFYVGKDDVHGVLKYLLARASVSVKLNMFGYDDDELDAVIQHLLVSEHVFVQGTLDKSQAGGVHEKKLIAAWPDAVRSSFAIGESATHQISHTKGGVIDGIVAWEGSTNWSNSGEGTIVAADGSDVGRKAQNNTLLVYTAQAEMVEFATELDEEHVVALGQQAPPPAVTQPTSGPQA